MRRGVGSITCSIYFAPVRYRGPCCSHVARHCSRCDNLIPGIVTACRWSVESRKLVYSGTFGYVPTCDYMNHRPIESFVPEQQRMQYVSVLYGWLKNE